MSGASRAKGLRGEREVADAFERFGWTVRGLEGQGDWLAFPPFDRKPSTATRHVECKRAERLKIPEWQRQAEAEAPTGAVPLLCFRQNHGPWYVVQRLEDYLR